MIYAARDLRLTTDVNNRQLNPYVNVNVNVNIEFI